MPDASLLCFGAAGQPVSLPGEILRVFWKFRRFYFPLAAFNPFADEVSFLLGAFIFEDVGVTAYRGGAHLLTNIDLIFAAAGVLGTEAYHAANIRTTLLAYNDPTIIDTVQTISDLRDALDGPDERGQGIVRSTSGGDVANIVPTDRFGLVFARRSRQVLNIVYGAPSASSGLFYPEGLNGALS